MSTWPCASQGKASARPSLNSDWKRSSKSTRLGKGIGGGVHVAISCNGIGSHGSRVGSARRGSPWTPAASRCPPASMHRVGNALTPHPADAGGRSPIVWDAGCSALALQATVSTLPMADGSSISRTISAATSSREMLRQPQRRFSPTCDVAAGRRVAEAAPGAAPSSAAAAAHQRLLALLVGHHLGQQPAAASGRGPAGRRHASCRRRPRPAARGA